MPSNKAISSLSVLLFFAAIVITTAALNTGPKLSKEVSTPVSKGNNLRTAIIVGINEYDKQNGLRPLNYAVSDAELIGSAFQDFGYTTRLITEHKAVKSRILDVVKQEAARVGPDGTLVFFFAGHGFGHGDGENYLVTQDGLLHDLKNTALSITELKQTLKNSGVKRAALFLDACRDKPELLQSRSLFNPGFFYEKSEGFYTLYSTNFGNTSHESKELKQGIFSHVLYQGLRGDAAENKVITFSGLAKYVQFGVPEFLRINDYLGQDQQPTYDIVDGHGLLKLGEVHTPFENHQEPSEIIYRAINYTGRGFLSDGADNVDHIDIVNAEINVFLESIGR